MFQSLMDDVNVTVSVTDDKKDGVEEVNTTESNIPPQEGDEDVLDEAIDGDNEIQAVEDTTEAREELRSSIRLLNTYLKKHDDIEEMIADLKHAHLSYGWVNKWNADGLLTRTGLAMIPSVESFGTEINYASEAEVRVGLEGLGDAIWNGIQTVITKLAQSWKKFWEGVKLRWHTFDENVKRLREEYNENKPDIEDLAGYSIKVLPSDTVLELLDIVAKQDIDSTLDKIREVTSAGSQDVSAISKELVDITRDFTNLHRDLTRKLKISSALTLDTIPREAVLTILDAVDAYCKRIENINDAVGDVYQELEDWSSAMRSVQTTTSTTSKSTGVADMPESKEVTVSETDVTPGQIKNTIRIVENTVTGIIDFLSDAEAIVFEALRTASARIVQGTE